MLVEVAILHNANKVNGLKKLKIAKVKRVSCAIQTLNFKLQVGVNM